MGALTNILALAEKRSPLLDSGMKTEITTPPSWSAWLDLYLQWQLAERKPITTRKLRSYHIRRFASETELPPTEVTLDDIVDFMAENAHWSANYARSYTTTLRTFFRFARKRGLRADDPALDAPSIAAVIGKPRPASDAALAACEAAVDTRVRLMARLGNRVGMRCREICRARTDDIVGRRGAYLMIVHGKGNKERVVPIDDELARAILDHPRGYLFPGGDGGHLSAGYVSKLISWAMDGLGTAHQLRHRACTRWLRTSGGNLREVQELAGHASVATTQIYTLVDDPSLRRTAIAA